MAAAWSTAAARFEEMAAAHADRPAVVTARNRATYGELNAMANGVAEAILEQRDARVEPVALLLDKDVPAVASIVAALKAGKICVPLDPAFPDARLGRILEGCGAPLVLTGGELGARAQALAGAGRQVLNLDGLALSRPARNPGLPLAADTLAYMLFTSGSTGRPKAVVHDHGALLHAAMRVNHALRLGPQDRTILLASLSTAQAAIELFLALLNGAALFPRDLRREGIAGMAQWLNREGISYYRSSASVFREWIKQLSESDRFETLRLVKIGGEPVVRQDVEMFRRHFPADCRLVNALSASETWTFCLNVIGHDTPLDGIPVPVGRAVEGTEVFLAGDDGAPVAAGETGEFVVRGRSVAVGYWRDGQPDRSDFTASDGSRRFRTGDLGCQLPDGSFMHLGRKDSVVKIRGHRIDVGEIESLLREHPQVRQAAVVARDDQRGDARLVAYVVPAGEVPPTQGDLRRYLLAQLPQHMMPDAFVLTLELPMTPSGKIERRSLPAYAAPVIREGNARDASGTLVGAQLCTIWEDVLGVPRVGLDDNFLELGGNSLLALTMTMRIEQLCGRSVPLSRLLEGITIGQLTRMLAEGEQHNFGKPIVRVQAGDGRPALFWLHGDFDHGGLYCHNLARLLGPEQPFYAVTPHGLDESALPWSIEDMANDRLAALRAIQPHGPYRLGGFCIGGTVAYEMARRLRAQGEEVGRLLLVDSRAINAPPLYASARRALSAVSRRNGWSEEQRRSLFLRARMHLWAWQLSGQPGGQGRVKFIGRKLAALMRRATPGTAPGAGPPPTTQWGDIDVKWERFLAYNERQEDYLPGRYDGAIALFRSSHLDDKPPLGPTAGWRHVTPDVAVHYVPGNHQACVTRHVAVLAEQMRPYLAPGAASHCRNAS